MNIFPKLNSYSEIIIIIILNRSLNVSKGINRISFNRCSKCNITCNRVKYYLKNQSKVYFLDSKLYSKKLKKGTNTRKYIKYRLVKICPNSINGLSTCLAPSIINDKNIAINI